MFYVFGQCYVKSQGYINLRLYFQHLKDKIIWECKSPKQPVGGGENQSSA